MSNIRRYDSSGKPYFITSVTYKRQAILGGYEALLYRSFVRARDKFGFDLIAWVIIPDHFHLLMDARSIEISRILHWIKQSFSMNYRKANRQPAGGLTNKAGQGRVWQYRFWDHIIRDEIDFNRHLDYIHYNPVKHEIVGKPFDYRFSSIHQYREYYQDDWGVKEPVKIEGDFGE